MGRHSSRLEVATERWSEEFADNVPEACTRDAGVETLNWASSNSSPASRYVPCIRAVTGNSPAEECEGGATSKANATSTFLADPLQPASTLPAANPTGWKCPNGCAGVLSAAATSAAETSRRRRCTTPLSTPGKALAFSPFFNGGRVAVTTGRFSSPFFPLFPTAGDTLRSQFSTSASPVSVPPNNRPCTFDNLIC